MTNYLKTFSNMIKTVTKLDTVQQSIVIAVVDVQNMYIITNANIAAE